MQTAPKFKLNDELIVKLARTGLGNYIPYIPGTLAHLEEEGGVTVTSTENLEKIVKKCGPPESAEIVPEGILFFFPHAKGFRGPVSLAYLATGFVVGYRGEGPTGFARFISKCWDVDFEMASGFVSNCVQKHGGTIRPKKGLEFQLNPPFYPLRAKEIPNA